MKQQNGKVGLKRLMESVGKTLSDLPKIPGTSNACYNFIMGNCWGSKCPNKAGHLGRMQIPNKFADDLCVLISPAIKSHFNGKAGRNGGPRGVKREKK